MKLILIIPIPKILSFKHVITIELHQQIFYILFLYCILYLHLNLDSLHFKSCVVNFGCWLPCAPS